MNERARKLFPPRALCLQTTVIAHCLWAYLFELCMRERECTRRAYLYYTKYTSPAANLFNRKNATSNKVKSVLFERQLPIFLYITLYAAVYNSASGHENVSCQHYRLLPTKAQTAGTKKRAPRGREVSQCRLLVVEIEFKYYFRWRAHSHGSGAQSSVPRQKIRTYARRGGARRRATAGRLVGVGMSRARALLREPQRHTGNTERSHRKRLPNARATYLRE